MLALPACLVVLADVDVLAVVAQHVSQFELDEAVLMAALAVAIPAQFEPVVFETPDVGVFVADFVGVVVLAPVVAVSPHYDVRGFVAYVTFCQFHLKFNVKKFLIKVDLVDVMQLSDLSLQRIIIVL